MSATAEQLAAELEAYAVAEFVPLPPLPKPAPAKPAPAAAPAAAGAATPAPTAPAPAVPAAPPPPPPKPVQIVDFAFRGFHLEATVDAAKVVDVAHLLDRHGFAIDAVTGQDWPAQELMEVIYDFLHFQTGLRVVIHARVPRAEPRIATIVEVFSGANWHERETHDFFGIEFTGHPNLTPFLLPDDADYHPLKKDFAP